MFFWGLMKEITNADKEKIALCEGRHETMRLLHFDFSRMKEKKQVTKLK